MVWCGVAVSKLCRGVGAGAAYGPHINHGREIVCEGKMARTLRYATTERGSSRVMGVYFLQDESERNETLQISPFDAFVSSPFCVRSMASQSFQVFSGE